MGVEFREVCDRGHPEEALAVTDDSFDPALLIASGHVAGVDRKSIMTRKLQKSRIVSDGGIALQNDAAQVVITMAMGDPADLVKRPDVAVQEKLQALAGIEADDGVTRPGQDIDESIDRRCPDLPFHPVHLAFFPGQEGQLGKRFRTPFPKLHRRQLDRSVATGVAVPAQPVEDLEGHEGRRRFVPLGDQPLVGGDDRGLPGFFDRLSAEDPGDGSSSHLELLGNLAPGQVVDFPQSPNLDPACLVHRPEDKSLGRRSRSRLVSSPRPGRQKGMPLQTFEHDLVLYHLPSKSTRHQTWKAQFSKSLVKWVRMKVISDNYNSHRCLNQKCY